MDAAMLEAFLQTDLLQQSSGASDGLGMCVGHTKLFDSQLAALVRVGTFDDLRGLPLWASGACVTAAAVGAQFLCG